MNRDGSNLIPVDGIRTYLGRQHPTKDLIAYIGIPEESGLIFYNPVFKKKETLITEKMIYQLF